MVTPIDSNPASKSPLLQQPITEKKDDTQLSIENNANTTPVITPSQPTPIEIQLVNEIETSHAAKLTEFKNLASDLQSINEIKELLAWDQMTYMLEKAGDTRAKQSACLSKLSHEIYTSDKMGELINHFKKEPNIKKINDIEKALLREAGKEYDKRKKLPTGLVEELENVTSKANTAWVSARKNNKFSDFAPYLEKVFSLKRKVADLIGYEKSPYDALLDEFESGMTAEKLDHLFGKLKDDLIPLIKQIKESPIQIDNSFLFRLVSDEKQMEISRGILNYMGFEGRLDKTTHPFSASIGLNDARITTRSNKNLFSFIGTILHEGGHALYEPLGIDPALANTLLFTGASIGVHESQSRLMETQVGLSKPFWKGLLPILKNWHLSEQLHDIELEQFYKAINKVEPSFIRVGSDEVTYNLHIILRFELEKALLEGKLAVKDVPEVWNQKMQEYFGITPKTDTEGCLQDMHWSGGAIGYFPTYTIGNLLAAQIYNSVKKDIPELDKEITKRELTLLREWLREKIHKYGKTLLPAEIIKNATGEDLKPDYFSSYLKKKYSEIYELKD